MRSRMRARHVSFKQALNDVIREGATDRDAYVFATPSRPMGLRVDVTKANQIAGELDDEEVFRKTVAES